MPAPSGELDALAAACLFAPFEGVAPPPWLLEWIEAGLGGAVLFSRNVRDAEQVAALTGALHEVRPDVVVATDEEGGDVTRLEWRHGSSYPGNLALGVLDDVGLTERVARAIGDDLAAVGVDLDFAPVADVNTNPDNPVIGVRSFGSDPQRVARHVAAFVRGLQDAGVAACAKHFPGHGDTGQDSHLDLPTAGGDLEAALPPFRAAIDAGVCAVMTAHVVVPAVDALPATLSARILKGLLREGLGFDGLVVTDALEMRAVSATFGIEEAAVRSLAAGADALCLGAALDPEAVAAVHAAVVDAVRTGRLTEQRLRDASARTGAVRAPPRAGPATDRSVGLTAARAAVRVEGDPTLAGTPLVVELRPEPSIAAGEQAYGLGGVLGAETVRLDEHEPLPDLEDGRGVAVVVRDPHRHDWARRALESLLAALPDAVVVDTGVPVWLPERARGYVATHGAARVNLVAAAERLRPRPQ